VLAPDVDGLSRVARLPANFLDQQHGQVAEQEPGPPQVFIITPAPHLPSTPPDASLLLLICRQNFSLRFCCSVRDFTLGFGSGQFEPNRRSARPELHEEVLVPVAMEQELSCFAHLSGVEFN